MKKLFMFLIVFMSMMAFGKAPNLPSIDFGLEVAKGNINAHSAMVKFGENPDIDTGTVPEDAWDFGGLYTFSTTADIDSVASSDDTDDQNITVIGLDENWLEVSQTVTITGQTRAALTTSLIRMYRAYNNSATNISGNVSIYVDTTLSAGVPVDTTKMRGQIRDGNNQTLMCIYTVPAGKTGYFTQGYVGTSKDLAVASTINSSWRARLFGQAFSIKGKIGLNNQGAGSWIYKYSVPVELPAKTDVLIRIDAVSASNTAFACGFDIILVDD